MESQRAAARRAVPCSDDVVSDALLNEASLSHMSRSATEARLRASAEWITSNAHPERRYRPPSGRGLRRQHLRSTRKELAGRYYQFLSGHGAFGSYLKDKLHKVDWTEAGGATPASASPDSTSWPGAGQARVRIRRERSGDPVGEGHVRG